MMGRSEELTVLIEASKIKSDRRRWLLAVCWETCNISLQKILTVQYLMGYVEAYKRQDQKFSICIIRCASLPEPMMYVI